MISVKRTVDFFNAARYAVVVRTSLEPDGRCIQEGTKRVQDIPRCTQMLHWGHSEVSTMMDFGPIIYAVLLVYVVGGILCLVLLSLGAWGIATCAKRLHEKKPRKTHRVQRIRSFLHLPHHGRA